MQEANGEKEGEPAVLEKKKKRRRKEGHEANWRVEEGLCGEKDGVKRKRRRCEVKKEKGEEEHRKGEESLWLDPSRRDRELIEDSLVVLGGEKEPRLQKRNSPRRSSNGVKELVLG